MRVLMTSRDDGSTEEVSVDYARERLEPNWYTKGTVDEILANDEWCQLASCSFIYCFTQGAS